MGQLLNVLIFDDNAADSRLVVHELKKTGFDLSLTHVDSAETYAANLSAELDLIIAGFSLPQFSAPRALALLRESNLDIPFIVVAGTATQEKVVECIRGGAYDYLLTDRLGRLGPAVTAALATRKDREEQHRTALAVKRRDAILEAVNQTAVALLSTPDWKDAIGPELARLGAAADALHVCIFQLEPSVLTISGAPYCGWGSSEAAFGLGVTLLQESDVVCRASESLRTILASGEVRVLAVSDLPEHERGFLARQDIESVLVAPVVAGDEAWGALAFGERKSSRDWSPPETGALETAARVLGAVVYRERVALALRQSERRNRAILTAIPDIMFRLGRNGVIIGHKAIQIGEKEIAADALDGQSVRRHFLNALPDIEAKVSNVLETGIPFLAEQVQLSIDPGRLYELRIVRTGDQESLAIARDITDRHRSEQRTRALNSATNVLTEAETVSEMIVSMLDVLGSNLGFDTAAYWVVDTDRGALRLAEMWHRDLAATRTFEAAARDLSIFPGNGVAGRVWATRGSTWIEDVRVEGGFLMVASAELSNLETAFAFAVTAGGTVHGVIELLSGARRMPDPNLVANEKVKLVHLGN